MFCNLTWMTLIHKIVGATLTGLSGLAARCAPPGDLVTRRNIERAVFELRKELASIGSGWPTRLGSRHSANRADGAATQGARFRVLEREFKQGVPVIVSDDYPPTAGGRLVH